jgi:trans-aconitate methyltransferase
MMDDSAGTIWDRQSSYFNTANDHIEPGAADNILIAWPPILGLIKGIFPKKENVSALDFGCGAGGFSAKLSQMGFSVTGVDPSGEMIKLALSNSPGGIEYITGDVETVSEKKFNLITAIMVFQFIQDIDNVLIKLLSLLEGGGLIIFAVFNPGWVRACLEKKLLFKDFDSIETPKKGLIDFGEGKEIPVYLRSFSEYGAIFRKNKMKKVMEIYPPLQGNIWISIPWMYQPMCLNT